MTNDQPELEDHEYEYKPRWSAILFGVLLCGAAATVAAASGLLELRASNLGNKTSARNRGVYLVGFGGYEPGRWLPVRSHGGSSSDSHASNCSYADFDYCAKRAIFFPQNHHPLFSYR